MPKIQWTDLPPALRDHLFDRLRERKISADDLFRICGEGKFPKTFLLSGQSAKGKRLE